MACNVRMRFVNRGFRQVLCASGTVSALMEQGRRMAAGVSADKPTVKAFKSRGGARMMVSVRTRCKTDELAYEARKQLAGAVR